MKKIFCEADLFVKHTGMLNNHMIMKFVRVELNEEFGKQASTAQLNSDVFLLENLRTLIIGK